MGNGSFSLGGRGPAAPPENKRPKKRSHYQNNESYSLSCPMPDSSRSYFVLSSGKKKPTSSSFFCFPFLIPVLA
jgi:hypothetical protein